MASIYIVLKVSGAVIWSFSYDWNYFGHDFSFFGSG